jgi:2',3'-cyclic-nucleotide 2'-phosphodiesterase (5'-nucleotidase family)
MPSLCRPTDIKPSPAGPGAPSIETANKWGGVLNGVPIDPAGSYQVTTNDFLANGGDGFTNLTKGTGRTTTPGFDVDALVAYLGAGAPVTPGPADRITKLG